MFNFIKGLNKDYPEFWKNYLHFFQNKPNKYVSFVVETTGLNIKTDKIISIAAIGITNQKIQLKDNFEMKVSENVSEAELIEKFINFIGNSIIVGHHCYFDVEILNVSLQKLNCGLIKNEALDIEIMYKKLHDILDKNFSLQELMDFYAIKQTEHNQNIDDCFTISLLFLKLKSRLNF